MSITTPSSEHPGSTSKQCPAIRRDGQPCQASAGASGYCVGHRPGAQAARQKGGAGRSIAARADKRLPPRLRSVADMLEKAMREVHRGDLEPRQATAIAALAGALVRVVQAGDLDERLEAVERVLKLRDRRP